MATRTRKTITREVKPLPFVLAMGKSRYDAQGNEITATAATGTISVLDAFLAQVDASNSVSLVELRKACGLTRQDFDAQLNTARRSGVLSMSALEGRNGASQEQLDACLVEHGEQLLYVHRYQS